MPKPSLLRTRWQRWALSILGAVIVLMLAAWLLVPRWLAGPGARTISQALGREFSVTDVRFHPWTLGLEIDGARIAGAQPADPPLLAIRHLEAELSLRSLWHASPVLASLRIDQPVIHAARLAPGHYDFDDLLARVTKPPPQPQPDDKPPQLGLYNISLKQGQVLLDDRPVGRHHELSDLQLELPFISTLAADVAVAVQPRISGKLNGVAFGSDAQLLPFSERREASLDFKLSPLDLAPYLGYLPEGLPLRLQRGHIDARLSAHFVQAPKGAPQFQLSGEVGLADVALQTPAGEAWLDWHELRVELKDVEPLRQQIALGKITWTGPTLALRTDGVGRLWLPVGEAPAEPAPKPQPAQPWAFSIASFDLKQGTLDWSDASTPTAVALRATDLNALLGPAAWPLKKDASLALSYGLQLQPSDAGAGKTKATPATLNGDARLTADQLAFRLQWQDLALGWLNPYLQTQLLASLKGQAGGRAELTVARPLEAEPMQRAVLSLQDLSLDKLTLGTLHAGETVFELEGAQLDQLKIDLGAKQIQAGELALQRPVVQAIRGADGQWRHDALLPVAHHEAAAPASSAPPTPPTPPAPFAWHIAARGLRLEQGSIRLQDARAGDQPVQVDQIQMRLQDLAWPAKPEPIPAQLGLAIGHPRGKDAATGRLQWQGQVLLAPWGARGKLQVDQLPLQLLDPYLDPSWGLQLRRAELGLKGEFAVALKPEGVQATWHGDAQLARLRVNQASWAEGKRTIGDELLGWQSLDLGGLSIQAKPGSPAEVTVANARLDDYYVRLNVNEQGQFNITDLGAQADATPAAGAAPAPVAASAPSSSSAPATPKLLLMIGQTRFSKGEVDFSDHFIRPNYSAHLTELEGSLGAIATARPAMAPLSLRGKVEGTGELTVEGQWNPLASPPTLDVKAHASDIELSPLSPYAAKYAGYAIERGKLSTQVEYRIDASGTLQASNKIRLDQLTFGDKVDSPDATTLPVRLAVALLKDSDGVIDIELPVSGSINDPDFSIGGLVFKLIVNLLGKALTAPFSLFSGGGNADLSQAAFAPGNAVPTAPDQLDKVAKMLTERPALELTISGSANAAADGPALLQRQADAAAEAESRRAQRRQQKGVKPAAQAPGKTASAPAPAVSQAELQELAEQRAEAVRDALIARGVPNARLFLGSARLSDGSSADWQPHADLSLSAR